MTLSPLPLADEADVSWPTVQRVEAGMQAVSLDVLGSLARALGMKVSELVAFEEKHGE